MINQSTKKISKASYRKRLAYFIKDAFQRYHPATIIGISFKWRKKRGSKDVVYCLVKNVKVDPNDRYILNLPITFEYMGNGHLSVSILVYGHHYLVATYDKELIKDIDQTTIQHIAFKIVRTYLNSRYGESNSSGR